MGSRAPERGFKAEDVLEHLETVLDSPLFRRSLHASRLLRTVVERTLARDFDQLKETVLAIDVFGREPEFNPKADPIVRIEAGKLRKRLNKYYSSTNLDSALRIALPVGSYVAEFTCSQACAQPPTIAVGAFCSATGEHSLEYLAYGLRAELISCLAAAGEFRICSRENPVSRPGFADPVLQATVAEDTAVIRAHVQLISGLDGVVDWAATFERPRAQIALAPRDILSGLLAHFHRRMPPLPNPIVQCGQAYETFMRGLWKLADPSPAAANTAMQLFERAIEMDPSLAAAYTGTARALVALGWYGDFSPQLLRLAKERARVALALDPRSPNAHIAMGTLLGRFYYQWAESESHFRRAIELDGSNAEALWSFSANCLVPTGRFDEALAELARAAELEPLATHIPVQSGFVLGLAGRFEEAAEQYAAVLKADRGSFHARYGLAILCLASGRFDESIDELEALLRIAPDTTTIAALLCLALTKSGLHDRAKACRARYFPNPEAVPPGAAVLLAVAEDDLPRAMQAAALAIDRHDPNAYLFALSPEFAGLRAHPEGRQLLAAVGLDRVITAPAP